MGKKGYLMLAVALAPFLWRAYKRFISDVPSEIAVVDMTDLRERSLPGRSATQYLKTVETVLQRNVDEAAKALDSNPASPEAQRAVAQAKASLVQQTALYSKELDEEIASLAKTAAQSWLSKNPIVSAVVDSRMALASAKQVDVTERVMDEMNLLRPSFPPLPIKARK